MRSYTITSPKTMNITEEDGTVFEWVRAEIAAGSRSREDYDFKNKLKVKGNWYVTNGLEVVEGEEE